MLFNADFCIWVLQVMSRIMSQQNEMTNFQINNCRGTVPLNVPISVFKLIHDDLMKTGLKAGGTDEN